MTEKQLVRLSKFISKHLRHEPESIGLTLQAGGWVAVEDLLAACHRAGLRVERAELDDVVRRSDKQRFAFDETGVRIRANQGHSVEVDLQLEPAEPPQVLYHGTAVQFVDAIVTAGIQRMSRHHVHLSADIPTAIKVGSRHGQPVVLTVDAAAMRQAGVLFYRSANGVWLVDAVAPQYLRVSAPA
jgi:putative RNA 2'-phosphotransferase